MAVSICNYVLLFKVEFKNIYKEIFKKISFILLLMVMIFYRYFSIYGLVLFIPYFFLLGRDMYQAYINRQTGKAYNIID